MGLTFNLGRVSPSVFTDSSLNIGIGAAPSGTYKLEVTGTAKVSSTLLVSGAATFSSSVQADFLVVGTTAATSGGLRLGTQVAIRARNVANNANIPLIESTATDAVAIASGGANVGIGTSSPITRLQVIANTPTYLYSAGQLDVRTQESQAANRGAMISIGGNATSNNTPYNFGIIGAYKVNSTVDDFSSYMIFGTSDVYSNVFERMRITTNGDVYIGNPSISTANAAIFLQKSGIITTVRAYSSGTIPLVEFYKQNAGDIGSITYNGTNTLYGGTSDYRLKEDLKDYNALDIVNQLKTYNFKWKDTDVRDYGMMAHELQEILPNYVSGEKDAIREDGSIKSQNVDYSKLVPILIKGMQEQQEMITSLQDRLDKAGL